MVLNDEKVSKCCPLCGSNKIVRFYEMINVPTSCNVLWAEKNQAINCPKGDVILCFCESCSFIFNCALEPEKNQYLKRYDNSLFYSKQFQDFVKKMVLNLIQKYNVRNKTVMEVTVGKVDFLSFFCAFGPNTGVKFDASLINAGYYNHKALSSEKNGVDYVFSYHELEHANDPKQLLLVLKDSINETLNPTFYFSVPNIYKAFSKGDFTNVIYEHPSYFTFPSLRYMFSCCGYNVLNIIEEDEGFGYDSISVVASLNVNTSPTCPTDSKKAFKDIKSLVLSFADKSNCTIKKASNQIKPFLDKGKSVIVWGAGARGVTFLNILKDQRIEYVVDINPSKQGMYVPGTGQKIVSPNHLLNYKPDAIILANSTYQNEIRKMLTNLNVNAPFIFL